MEGLGRLPAVRWLYLDHNRLPEAELLRLPGEEPAGLGWAATGACSWAARQVLGSRPAALQGTAGGGQQAAQQLESAPPGGVGRC